jgi:hypothetical protein
MAGSPFDNLKQMPATEQVRPAEVFGALYLVGLGETDVLFCERSWPIADIS